MASEQHWCDNGVHRLRATQTIPAAVSDKYTVRAALPVPVAALEIFPDNNLLSGRGTGTETVTGIGQVVPLSADA